MGESLLRELFTICPEEENALSEEALEAGMHKYFIANLYIKAKFILLFFQKINGSSDK